MRTKEIAGEWNKMAINPIDKNAGWLEMVNKRGLFLTNIISKCVEKILFTRRENTLKEMLSPFQNGGLTLRAIQDNLFILNHTINVYRKKGKNLYILFSDVEKCFDNLWLRDCIIELVRCGTPIEEAMYIFKMNSNVEATIRTPVGEAEEIKLTEIVRQGTVGGNKLCIVSTDRINRMGSYLEEEGIRYLIFVDDKLGAGSVETRNERKMKTLETTKKYTYNTKKGKTEWMMIKNNKRKEEPEPELEVNSGKIGRTKEYKYVGDKYDEKGTNESKIKHKDSKVNLMINDIKTESTEKKLGKAALKTRIMLIETIITPTILSSTETWNNITQDEQNMIKNIHKNILTKTLNLPITTPYMGIISELNIIPYVEMIWYKKFMWFHRLINSDAKRMARIKLVEQMEENDDNWYTELRCYAERNGITFDETSIRSTTYPQYKEHMYRSEFDRK